MRARSLGGSDGQACLGALLKAVRTRRDLNRDVTRTEFCFRMEIFEASTISAGGLGAARSMRKLS